MENSETTIVNKFLENRMVEYAIHRQSIIGREQYYIVRLDGNKFSTFTKQFNKPFDIRFIMAMKNTQIDMHKKFNPLLTYTHSDEVSLVFDKTHNENQVHFFNGRVEKITTLLASYCSIRFAFHMSKYEGIDKTHEQIFDARVLIINDDYELANYFVWRSIRDCERNAVSAYANKYVKTTIKYKCKMDRIKLLEDIGIIWHLVPIYIRYGIYCKNKIVCKIKDDKTFYRTEIECKGFAIKCDEDNINMILSKSWNNTCYSDSNDVTIEDHTDVAQLNI